MKNNIDIARPYFGKEEENAVIEVLRSGILVRGPKTKELERLFAAYTGKKHAIAVSSGTAALECALKILAVGENQEVITTPFTFVATVNTILLNNAKPVFVDIDEETYTINATKIKEKITRQTKALLPVDLFGQCCDYDLITALAKQYSLHVVEDACQAIGAQYKQKKAGSFGDIGVFSLYATKNITCGEGGIIVTDNEMFARKMREFSNQGQTENELYAYTQIGVNYRMTEMQAAIAIEQMKKVEERNAKRIQNAILLSRALLRYQDKIHLPSTKNENTHVFHQYTIRVQPDQRNHLVAFLKERSIGVSIFYPKPLHLYPHIQRYGYNEGDFPVAERIAKEVISLPIHPLVNEQELIRIADTLGEFYAKN